MKNKTALELLIEAYEENTPQPEDEKTIGFEIEDRTDPAEDDLPLHERLRRGFARIGFKNGESVGK